ncbi:carboxymuconolactone decarboxylase family protein [Niabella terrae]
MNKRININSAEPKALKAMMGLESYLYQTAISDTLKDLIKIRASQLNGCGYCIDLHSKAALKNGETNQRIFLLNAWKETQGIFTEEEKAVLSITEAVTLIHQNGLPETIYENARQHFDENQIAQIIMAVVIINSWNRIAISSLLQPGESFS